MQIFVPTYGRAKESVQSTLLFLRLLGVEPTLVVQEREADKYSFAKNVAILPDSIRTISPTRDYIVSTLATESKILMLDDDLVFFTRSYEDRTKFVKGRLQDYHDMLETIDNYLDLHPHVGIANREGGNRNTERLILNTRIMRVLGYNVDILKAHEITFHPMEVMEDFHVSLQLLRKGFDTLILNDWCHNQGGSGTAGGCSHFRTMEVQHANAHRLAQLHPKYVSTVTKQTKTAWGGKERTDVIIQWKKARNEHDLT